MWAGALLWVSGGDPEHWYGQVYGDFWYDQPPYSGPETLLAGGWTPDSDSYVALDQVWPLWQSGTTLDGRGDGAYWTGGWGNVISDCGHNYQYLHADTWSYDFVVRPTVTVTGHAVSSHAFWYLGGAPSIDGYYTQVALTAYPNWAPPQGQQASRTWHVTANPQKVSLSTTTGTQTTVTSQAASNGIVYDVKIAFKIDGFSSNEFPLHINKPVLLDRTSGGITVDWMQCPGKGWSMDMTYMGRDLWGNALQKITTHEEFSNWALGNTPPTVGWPYPSPATWNPSDPNEWVTTYEFKDTMWAYDCSQTWDPLPRGPWQDGGNRSARSANQKVYMGSGSPGQGSHVTTTIMTWYTDHGTVVP